MQATLDYRHLQKSSVGLVLTLVLCSWVSLCAFGILVLLLSLMFGAAGIAAAGVFIVFGFIAWPLMGLTGAAYSLYGSGGRLKRHFRATVVDHNHKLYRMTAEMADALGLPLPEVCLYESEDINAWAAGPNEHRAVIGITSTLARCEDRIIQAVIAHELGHIAFRDVQRMELARGFHKALFMILRHEETQWLVSKVYAPLSELVLLAVSRKREYWADAFAAAMVGNDTMIEALAVVHAEPEYRTRKAKKNRYALLRFGEGSVFSTHPTLEQRVQALEANEIAQQVRAKLGWNWQGPIVEPVQEVPLESRAYGTTWNDILPTGAMPPPRGEPLRQPYRPRLSPPRLTWPYDAAFRGDRLATWFNDLPAPQALAVLIIPTCLATFWFGVIGMPGRSSEPVHESRPILAATRSPEVAGWMAALDEMKQRQLPSRSENQIRRPAMATAMKCLNEFDHSLSSTKLSLIRQTPPLSPDGTTILVKFNFEGYHAYMPWTRAVHGVLIRCWDNAGARDLAQDRRSGLITRRFASSFGSDVICGASDDLKLADGSPGVFAYCQ